MAQPRDRESGSASPPGTGGRAAPPGGQPAAGDGTRPRDSAQPQGPQSPASARHPGSPSDHLANERTFLAWMRTGVALVALGFVVARFGLLLRELAARAGVGRGTPQASHVSSYFGTGIVVLSAIFLVLSYVRYVRADEALDHGQYRGDRWLTTAVAVLVSVIALLLAVYLLVTP